MIEISKGRYWDLPWSLVSGCTPCSPGCERCWNAAMERRFGHLAEKVGNNPPRFTGNIETHPERLSIPLKRRKPTVYSCWNDLFHEAVDDDFRTHVYQMIWQSRRHTFLILTKRPENMARYLRAYPYSAYPNVQEAYHGLTVCNQQEADEKIPVFLQVPGKKFLSIEPMLGEINIVPYIGGQAHRCKCGWHDTELDLLFIGEKFRCIECGEFTEDFDAIKSVILGGETGPGARPMHPDWVRSVRDQCSAAGVPFFFKQWGEWTPVTYHSIAGCEHPSLPTYETDKFEVFALKEDRFNRGYKMGKVGRKAAGRLLDGRTYDELPWREA